MDKGRTCPRVLLENLGTAFVHPRPDGGPAPAQGSRPPAGVLTTVAVVKNESWRVCEEEGLVAGAWAGVRIAALCLTLQPTFVWVDMTFGGSSGAQEGVPDDQDVAVRKPELLHQPVPSIWRVLHACG